MDVVDFIQCTIQQMHKYQSPCQGKFDLKKKQLVKSVSALHVFSYTEAI